MIRGEHFYIRMPREESERHIVEWDFGNETRVYIAYTMYATILCICTIYGTSGGHTTQKGSAKKEGEIINCI